MSINEAKKELIAARADHLAGNERGVRRPRVMYTSFGGINLEAVTAWTVLPSGKVRVEFAARDITLEGREALQFLRMMGDARARSPEFVAFDQAAAVAVPTFA